LTYKYPPERSKKQIPICSQTNSLQQNNETDPYSLARPQCTFVTSTKDLQSDKKLHNIRALLLWGGEVGASTSPVF